MLATAAPPAGDTTPGWLQADDTETSSSLLDDSWLNPSARRANNTAVDTPDWLRRDELEASVAPASQLPSDTTAQHPDELPDWLRDIADQSRQRLEARAQEPAAPAVEEPAPAAQPTLSGSDELPDWLRDISAHNAPDTAPSADDASDAGDTPPWKQDQAASPPPAQAAVVEGELVAVEVGEGEGATPGTAIVEAADSAWPADDGSSLGSLGAGMVEESHARVYDVPDNTVWSVQPDRPAPDGSTGQQTAVWATPDETARAIVPQPEAYQLPSWLVDDDIEPEEQPVASSWSPPSWLEDSDVDGPPVRQGYASWTPPSWLDDDDDATLPAPSHSKGAPSWLANRDDGGVAVANATATTTQIMARPAEGQSAELLQRLLAEPSPETAAEPSRGGGTMLIVIVVVLLVMAALVFVFAAPALLGINLF